MQRSLRRCVDHYNGLVLGPAADPPVLHGEARHYFGFNARPFALQVVNRDASVLGKRQQVLVGSPLCPATDFLPATVRGPPSLFRC